MRAYRFNLEPGPSTAQVALSLAVRLALLPLCMVVRLGRAVLR